MEYLNAVMTNFIENAVGIDKKELDTDMLAHFVFELRELGEFSGAGWYLSKSCDWMIIRDPLGGLVLVPLKKKT